MNQKTLWDGRLGMLMACGSPGSALAYHLGQTTFEPKMVRRSTGSSDGLEQTGQTPASNAATSGEPETQTAGMGSVADWLTRAWSRLEAWSWQRQQRAQEAYLAQAR